MKEIELLKICEFIKWLGFKSSCYYVTGENISFYLYHSIKNRLIEYIINCWFLMLIRVRFLRSPIKFQMHFNKIVNLQETISTQELTVKNVIQNAYLRAYCSVLDRYIYDLSPEERESILKLFRYNINKDLIAIKESFINEPKTSNKEIVKFF